MKRYSDANSAIHTPADLRARVVSGDVSRTSAPRRLLIIATAAALLAALGLGAALLRPEDTPPPIAASTTETKQADSAPDQPSAETTTPDPANSPETEVNQPVPTLRLTEVSYPSQPQYPIEYEETAYDAWREADRTRRAASTEADRAGLADTAEALMQQFLISTDKTAGENRVISPLNLYLALAMLAETTDTTSRAALLELLSADTIEGLRSRASNLFAANYLDDGLAQTTLAASIWLRDGFPFRQDTLDRLALTHHAESYSGTMGSRELNAALQDWLNKNTGGLLREQVSGVDFDPDTVLGLATTIYFSARWVSEFRPELTREETFHAASGDILHAFMHSSRMDTYYDGNGFGAVRQSLTGTGGMWLILPDEGLTTDDLLAQGGLLNLSVSTPPADVEKRYARVNLALPKFDVTANLNLKDGLTALGLGDLFSPAAADFSPLTDNATLADELYLGAAQHAARVKIDEEGCEGAAFTLMMATATGGYVEVEEIDFVLDRPFIFIVTSATGAPLFAGVVEQP